VLQLFTLADQMDPRDHEGSGDDEDHSEGHEGEEEYEQEDPEEVIARDYDGDRAAYARDHPFAFGGLDGDVGEMLARLDPAILARVPRELLSGLDPAELANLLGRGEGGLGGASGGSGSGGSGGSGDQQSIGPPPPPDTNFEDSPSAVLAAISHPLTDPDTLVMALTSLSMMILMNQRGLQPSKFVSHICKCFVRKDMPQFIQEMCLQVPPPSLHRIQLSNYICNMHHSYARCLSIFSKLRILAKVRVLAALLKNPVYSLPCDPCWKICHALATPEMCSRTC
jgi:hypothetical protein